MTGRLTEFRELSMTIADSDMEAALIDIIMPAYNAASYVRDAIDSVMGQTHTNWHLIIVDDGSTDETLRIANSYRDVRIEVISQDRKGVSVARNVALKHRHGQFFCFLDADDILPPSSLKARLTCFQNNDVFFADGKVEIYDAEMERIIRRWSPRQVRDHFKSLIRLDGNCFFGPTWMVRNDPSIYYGFSEKLSHGEELCFYIDYAKLGRYCSTSEVVLRYRKTDTSAMSDVVGLARGYSAIGKKIRNMEGVSMLDYAIFCLRSRKFIALDFLRSGRPRLAIKYLVSGSIGSQ